MAIVVTRGLEGGAKMMVYRSIVLDRVMLIRKLLIRKHSTVTSVRWRVRLDARADSLLLLEQAVIAEAALAQLGADHPVRACYEGTSAAADLGALRVGGGLTFRTPFVFRALTGSPTARGFASAVTDRFAWS